MSRANREINVFSLSAVDLFANVGAVFIILMIVIMPNVRKQTTLEAPSQKDETPMITLEEHKKALEEQTKQVQEVTEENKSLQEKLEQAERDAKVLESQRAEAQNETRKLQEEFQTLKRQLASLEPRDTIERSKQTLEALKKTLAQTQQEKHTLEQELAKARRTLEQFSSSSRFEGAFVAVVIRWSTEKHDIDLVVRDPKGKVFDFKKRSYPKHPGLFALDSRMGPGAELFQSPELLPGVYTITYKFYNPYGNFKPATVEGTVFSKDGSITLPSTTMHYPAEREVTYKVSVSTDKKVFLSP